MQILLIKCIITRARQKKKLLKDINKTTYGTLHNKLYSSKEEENVLSHNENI
jgi:hypothetical protein